MVMEDDDDGYDWDRWFGIGIGRNRVGIIYLFLESSWSVLTV